MRIRETITKHIKIVCLFLAACTLGCVPSYAATTYDSGSEQTFSLSGSDSESSNEANISTASVSNGTVAYFAEEALDLISGSSSATKFMRNTTITSTDLQSKISAGTAVRIDSDNSNANATYKIYGWIDNGTIYWWSNANMAGINDDARQMFQHKSALTSISLEDIDTSSLTSMWGFFYKCSKLTKIIGLEKIDTSNVTNMSYMFGGCKELTSLDVSGFDVSNVTTMEGAFANCSSLQTINISGLNTSKVTRMNYMFAGCSSLLSLDMSALDVGSVTSVEAMFKDCSGLTTSELKLPHFAANNITSISYMFDGCTSLTSIDLSLWGASNIINAYRAFADCSSLESLDLGQIQISHKYANDYYMLENCAKLTSLTIGSDIKLTENCSLPTPSGAGLTGKWTLSNKYNHTDAISAGELITKSQATGGAPGTWVAEKNDPAYFAANAIDLIPNSGSATKFVQNTTISDSDLQAKISAGTAVRIDADKDNADASAKIYGWVDNGTIYWWTSTGTAGLNNAARLMFQNKSTLTSISMEGIDTSTLTTMDGFFKGCTALTEIPGIGDIDTSSVTHMSNTFEYCTSLASLDLSGLDTSKVTNMAYMFKNCNKLTSLNVSSLKTDSVTDMNSMFSECSSLASLDVTGFNTSGVADMSNMFYNCSSLTNLDVSKFDTSSVTSMRSMFALCSALPTLNTSGFNTSKVTNMSSMFYGCKELTTLDVSGFNTESCTDMSNMFYDCQKVAKLDVYKFKTGNVTNMSGMFVSCLALTSLDVSGFETGNVTNMGVMFYNCPNITYLDVSGFDTSNVTNMSAMFNNDVNLAKLDVSNFKTGKVTAMDWMFSNCQSLTVLDVSGFDTSSATTITAMFSDCKNVKVLDVSKFKTGKVTSMLQLFHNCSSLSKLDVSSFDTSNVTTMRLMFNNCYGLSSLDLSNFNTAQVEDMSYMFSSCGGLRTLKLTNFDTSKTTIKTDMFNAGTRLSFLTLGAKTNLAGSNLQAPYEAEGITGKWTLNDPYNSDDAVSAADLMTKSATANGAAGLWVAEMPGKAKIQIELHESTSGKSGALNGTFAIYDSAKKPIYCTTNSSGASSYVITVTNGKSSVIENDAFAEGNYTLVQLSTQSGFVKAADTAFTIAKSDLGSTKVLKVTNAKNITMPETGSDEALRMVQLATLLMINGTATMLMGNRRKKR